MKQTRRLLCVLLSLVGSSALGDPLARFHFLYKGPGHTLVTPIPETWTLVNDTFRDGLDADGQEVRRADIVAGDLPVVRVLWRADSRPPYGLFSSRALGPVHPGYRFVRWLERSETLQYYELERLTTGERRFSYTVLKQAGALWVRCVAGVYLDYNSSASMKKYIPVCQGLRGAG